MIKHVSIWSLHMLLSLFTNRKHSSLAASLSPSDEGTWQESIVNKMKVEQSNKKVITLGVGFKSNINGVIGVVVGRGNVDLVTIDSSCATRGTLWRPIYINVENGCDEEKVPKRVALAKYFILKEFSEIVHGTKNAKDKMLEANPNLKKASTIQEITLLTVLIFKITVSLLLFHFPLYVW